VVLHQQVARLTALERTLLIWLAVVREWTSLESLLALLVKRPTRARVLEALEALWRRFLIERGAGASFTLQVVVMEYVTDALLDHLSGEIRTMAMDHLHRYALEQAQAKDYVRETQVRVLVRPLVERLRAGVVDGGVGTGLGVVADGGLRAGELRRARTGRWWDNGSVGDDESVVTVLDRDDRTLETTGQQKRSPSTGSGGLRWGSRYVAARPARKLILLGF